MAEAALQRRFELTVKHVKDFHVYRTKDLKKTSDQIARWFTKGTQQRAARRDAGSGWQEQHRYKTKVVQIQMVRSAGG